MSAAEVIAEAIDLDPRLANSAYVEDVQRLGLSIWRSAEAQGRAEAMRQLWTRLKRLQRDETSEAGELAFTAAIAVVESIGKAATT